MALWITIVCIGLLTFAIRFSFIKLLGHVEIPALLLKILQLVPVTVLSAIALPPLFQQGGTLTFALNNPRLIAGLLAILVAWRTRNILLTIGVGMVALWVFQILLK